MDPELEKVAEDLAKRVPEFVNQNIEDWINRTIVRRAKSYARAANLPKQFIEGIRAEKTDKGYTLVNRWTTRGYENKEVHPASYFEFGTRDHWVEPVKAQALAWTHKPGKQARTAGRAIFFQGGAKRGQSLFSKGHYVSGIPKTLAMTRGVESGQKALRNMIRREVRKEFRAETEKYKIKVTV